MKNQKILFSILLQGVALLGLLWVQFLWINNAVKQSAKDFDTDVKKSLIEVSKIIEESNFCIDFYSTEVIPANKELSFTGRNDTSLVHDSLPFYFHNTFGKDSIEKYNNLQFNYAVQLQYNLKVRFLVEDSNWIASNTKDGEFTPYLEEEAIDSIFLDSILKMTLVNKGVDATYYLAVTNSVTGEITYKSYDDSSIIINELGYLQSLYDDNSYYDAHTIFLYFPDKEKIIWRNLWLVIAGSIVLLIILSLLFVSFIKMMITQKRLLEMRMDFINNMTHEFKTPISNIGLAVGALKGNVEQTKNKKLLEIIDEEKERLSEGISLVLTSTLLDKNELSLNKEALNLHDLIHKVVQNNELNFQNESENVRFFLDSKNPNVCVDEHHIINVFGNLLDNAVKYSDDDVVIGIRTKDVANGLRIMFTDNGVGIHSSNQKHIFDKFFRVSTQNRYETKGFGIGLYYVKMIVESHDGTIEVQSSLGKGTTFIIFIPQQDYEECK